MTERKIELVGSHRLEPEGAALVGDLDPDAPLAVTLYLQRRSAKPPPGSAADLANLMRPTTREALDRERARTHSRAAGRIVKFAEQNGIKVRKVDLTRRCVVLEAPAQRMAQAFGVSLRMYNDGRRTFRARAGALQIPREIFPWTRAVLGFGERPQVRNLAGNGASPGLWPTEIAALYGIPLDHDVSSQCVGIIAMGGGYLPSDLAKALAGMQRASPTLVEHPVSGVQNQFNGGTPADEEIALDLQILAGLLPNARIVIYFSGNTTQALAAAIHEAVFDEVNRPQVLSISWGSAEKYWTAPGRDAVQAALADAVRRRVSVVVAAGDELASSGVSDGKAHVWFPASSPYVLGCGGTAITLDGSVIASEAVWKDEPTGTGGGISDVFPVPEYQSRIALPTSANDGGNRRGVPDVAAAAARDPGYRIILNDTNMVQDGTSAATPLWASLIAMANARRGTPLGLVNSLLYSAPNLLRRVTLGDNRVNGIGYDAGEGWNACAGLGSPKGAEIIEALAAIPIA